MAQSKVRRAERLSRRDDLTKALVWMICFGCCWRSKLTVGRLGLSWALSNTQTEDVKAGTAATIKRLLIKGILYNPAKYKGSVFFHFLMFHSLCFVNTKLKVQKTRNTVP